MITASGKEAGGRQGPESQVTAWASEVKYRVGRAGRWERVKKMAIISSTGDSPSNATRDAACGIPKTSLAPDDVFPALRISTSNGLPWPVQIWFIIATAERASSSST